ncbi:MAG TPA: BlaI/MecI/CopY family transcriptional regulator [Candidatus Anaerostipes avistercoris]|uniref:BlaI/MecI/CopY family transcriptional regulator n=1 Tax=Candidatus Anaerostipes avistercoris TaxID=2838462 RepID=A0A9D2PM76_9FIRM|nr:BlaI/MecI/CopY family transcriptional regulator [Candidatus Anaerostipes avistercoris]
MKKIPQISEAEFEVMKVVWQKAPVSTTEVTDYLTRKTDWSPKTIQTMLKRLVTKNALTYQKEGRVFVYSPLISEEEYLDHKSHSFLSRYFHGDITALVSSYFENDQLSASDIETLREMLSKGGN